jgi:hypothetical protein
MTPAWLSRPPSVAELLMHYRDPARWRTRPVSDMPGAYWQAASLLLEGMIAKASERPGAANTFIPPYLFLWRHHIELQLKAILETVATDGPRWTAATGQAVPPDLFSGVQTSHSLLKLWRRVSPLAESVLQKQQYDWSLPTMQLPDVSALIDQLHQIDPGGDGVRYDRRNDGTLTMLGVNRVDLEHAQRMLSGIAEFLQWALREIGATMGVLLSEAATEEQLRQQWDAMDDDDDPE